MERPTIVRPRAIWRGDHNSEKFNLFVNQFLVELHRIAAVLNQQNDAIEADLDKTADSLSVYEDNPYHAYKADLVDVTEEDGTITQKPIPINLNLGGNPMPFVDLHKINYEYTKTMEKAKFILRSLG